MTIQVSPYLTFDGCCEVAFRFYESCLGGKISAMIPHGETPAGEHVAEDWQDKIIHAQLDLDGQLLMGTDAPPEHYEASQGFSVTLCVDDPEEAERVFSALAKDGSVRMPLEETFWARRFGMLVDGFGIPWMINCDRPE